MCDFGVGVVAVVVVFVKDGWLSEEMGRFVRLDIVLMTSKTRNWELPVGTRYLGR